MAMDDAQARGVESAANEAGVTCMVRGCAATRGYWH